jgi:hypothetical protein
MHILAQKILSSIILNIPSAITHAKPSAMQLNFFCLLLYGSEGLACSQGPPPTNFQANPLQLTFPYT